MRHTIRSLVTGGAGFLGSHVAKECIALGHKVTILDDLSGGFRDHVPREARFLEGSITDRDLVAKLFVDGEFDYIYHLAAYAAEGLSHFIRSFNYSNNVVGSMNIINECIRHQVKCLVFTSSIAVYGRNQVPMQESLTPLPEDPYGIAKYAVELDIRAAHELFGLPFIVFRPHNVYGEHQNLGDPYRNVIGIFMNRIMQGRSLPIFGDGKQTRAFSYVEDVSTTIARSVTVRPAYNQVFNVGADTPYTILELAEIVCSVFGSKSAIELLPARNEVLHAWASHERVRATFGDSKPIELAEGIKRMASWATGVGPRDGQRFKDIEIDRLLPESWRLLLR